MLLATLERVETSCKNRDCFDREWVFSVIHREQTATACATTTAEFGREQKSAL